jgi:hypothetical protein
MAFVCGKEGDPTIPTMDALRCLGFQPDPSVISDGTPGLSFDFGNLKLKASCGLNLRVEEIVLFSGVLSSPRTLAEVHFELPQRVNSLKQCAAWIVWNLDKDADGAYKPARHVDWIEEGRQNRKVLPWYKSLAEYEVRPCCLVERKWLRLALNTLAEQVASVDDQATFIFGFDGSVLSICCDGKLIVLAGQGPPWTVRFKPKAKALRCLPNRLMQERVGISLWKSSLRIGNWTYDGALEGFSTADSSRIQ